MARSTLALKYLGTGNFAVDLTIGYKQRISHVFTSPNEELDVTNVASLDELNRNSDLASLIDDGTLEVVQVPGTDDLVAEKQVTAAAVADAAAVGSATGVGVPLVIRKTFTGLVTGTADDVTIFASNAPYKFRVLDACAYFSANVASETISLRTATAGGGTLLAPAISGNAAGFARAAGTTPTATSTVAEGGSLYIRRSDRALAGEVIITIMREA